MSELSQPSEWATERFGESAQVLRRRIPVALRGAHLRALDGHLGLGLESNEAYGLMHLAQHEELGKALRDLEGVRTIKPRGARYSLTVINEVVLYPWRYAADSTTSVERARMRLSGVRRDLLGLAAPQASSQLTLDEAAQDDAQLIAEYEDIQELLQQMSDYGRLVVLAYASNPKAGLLRLEWGDASLADDDGHLTWRYRESLPPVRSGPEEETGWATVTPPPRPDAGPSGLRFDDAELVDPKLGLRTPLTEPTSEPQAPKPPTGSGHEDS